MTRTQAPGGLSIAARATVVVACYNHEIFVEKCLETVFNQSVAPDVIVTDDSSKDGTQARVLEILHRRGWTARTVFHGTNRGICVTFNEALALVDTPYVAFISADDWMAPQRVEEHVNALDESPDACLVYGDMYLASAEGTPMDLSYYSSFPDGWPGGDHDDLLERLIEFNWIPAPSVMSRTSALRRVGGYDESLAYEDHDMWLRLAKEGRQFCYLDRPLVYYRIHDSQMSRSSGLNAATALTKLRTYQKHIGFSPRSDAWIKSQSTHWIFLAYKHEPHPRKIALTILKAAYSTHTLRGFAVGIACALGIPATSLKGWGLSQ